jgi:isoaspartyl peptidase/L-asparaginase-like protein (Ntn-hydrolase superfamily)
MTENSATLSRQTHPRRNYTSACARALRGSPLDDSSALSIVERAIAILEDDECLNAGTGSCCPRSNITIIFIVFDLLQPFIRLWFQFDH